MAAKRRVAVVATAQTDHRRAATELNEVEMIQPVIREVLDRVGGISEIGFTCSGSSDYLAGQAFSFVMTLDAVGAWPPIQESHVEMDGAWALVRGVVEDPGRPRRHRAGLQLLEGVTG